MKGIYFGRFLHSHGEKIAKRYGTLRDDVIFLIRKIY